MEVQSVSKQAISENFWKKKEYISYFCAVLVFWIHCSSFGNYREQIDSTWIEWISIFLQGIITPVAVPLFLIVSGALFFRDYENDKYLEKVKRRVKSLLIPFVLWNTLNLLFSIFTSVFFQKFFIARQPFEFSYENIILGILHYKYNGPFWFVFALMAFTICAPFLDCLINNKHIGAIVIVLFMVASHFGIGLPTPLFYNQSCLVYYMVGAYVGKHYFSCFSDLKVERSQICVCIIILAACITYRYLQVSKSCEAWLFVEEICLVLWSFSMWNLFNGVQKLPRYEFLKNSFWVFALHINLGACVTKLCWMVLPKTGIMAILNFLLTTVVTLIIVELISRVVRYAFPKMYSMLSGGR